MREISLSELEIKREIKLNLRIHFKICLKTLKTTNFSNVFAIRKMTFHRQECCHDIALRATCLKPRVFECSTFNFILVNSIR